MEHAVQFSSVLVNWILMIGVIMAIAGKSPAVLLIGIILMEITVIFSLITLPVEFDASRRAKIQLLRLGLIDNREGVAVGKVLNAAALTYVAAMVSAAMELLHWFLIARASDRD